MRLYLLAATALTTTIWFLVPGAASAQSTRDWSGPYAGVTAGFVSTTSDVDFTYVSPATGPATADFSAVGAVLGLNLGYNIQVDSFVVGIEADGSFTTLDDTTEELPTYSVDERLQSLLTLRARFGVTNGPVFAYGTLGLAGGEANYAASVVDAGKGTPVPAEGSGFVTGLVGGAGVEVALNDDVSVKTEGLIYQLSPLVGSGDTGKGAFDSEYTASGLVVRSGLNVRF